MPQARIRGVQINYQVLGQTGPWVTLSPGGRRELEGIASLAERVAEAGYRVLIHDRRNCGASDVIIDGDESEYEIWADDLHELLSQLGALPVFAGGASSGCRLSLLLALRHPQAVGGLMLWRVTGGQFAAERLAQNYYGQFIEAAGKAGMRAVCETEFFAERIASNPANRDRLLAMDPKRFISVMENWCRFFLDGAGLPVIGVTAADLGSIRVPVCVIPGNDLTHPRRIGEAASRLIPGAELRVLMPADVAVDVDADGWAARETELAAMLCEFLNRASVAART